MLAPAVSQSMLNPMHPPLAKELIALSIAAFGDSALGWRYPATLFGALAIVAIYLCGLALFAAQGPAIAAALIAACNQMLYVQARVAMLDIFALGFGLLAIAAFMHGFRKDRPHALFAAAGSLFRLCGRLQMERPVSARNLHRHRRGDPPDAGLAHPVCRREAGGLVPA
ncbi:putative membrane-bound dolichyl-phosphate-mannose-protein mannosyltransferase [Bradyrhizobium sp. GM22.5]